MRKYYYYMYFLPIRKKFSRPKIAYKSLNVRAHEILDTLKNVRTNVAILQLSECKSYSRVFRQDINSYPAVKLLRTQDESNLLMPTIP